MYENKTNISLIETGRKLNSKTYEINLSVRISTKYKRQYSM